MAYRQVREAQLDNDLAAAERAVAKISEDSVYRLEARQIVNRLFDKAQPAKKDPPKKEPKEAPKDALKTSPCDKYDDIQSKGQEAFLGGRPSEALAAYEILYKCRSSEMTARLCIAAACKAKNVGKARQYWKKVSQSVKDQMLSLCSANGFFLKDLE